VGEFCWVLVAIYLLICSIPQLNSRFSAAVTRIGHAFRWRFGGLAKSAEFFL
jgi:hypothetical protein